MINRSPTTQTKRKPGTSASSSGSHLLKQSSSSPAPSPLAGRKQAGISSGTSKRTTIDEKSHRSSSHKTTTRVAGQQVPRSSAGAGANGGSGRGRDKGETRRGPGGDESSIATKQSSTCRGDGKEHQKSVQDSRDSAPDFFKK